MPPTRRKNNKGTASFFMKYRKKRQFEQLQEDFLNFLFHPEGMETTFKFDLRLCLVCPTQ